ncbi:MAG TPA: hypothetical protein VG269_15975 [Tepidisphaeraceae bacterium]|nr:hypothetical protein [Tepidisphaeraceae bacterium]
MLSPPADTPGRVRAKPPAQEVSPELASVGDRDGIQRLVFPEKRAQVFAGRFQVDDRSRLRITSVGDIAVDERAKCYGLRFSAGLDQARRRNPAVHHVVALDHPSGRFIVGRIPKDAGRLQLLNPQLEGLGLILGCLAEADPLARSDRPKLDPLPPVWFVTHACHFFTRPLLNASTGFTL